VIAFHYRVFDSPVHPLDLATGPRMVRFGQAVVNLIRLADHVEAHWPGIDCVPVPRLLCKLDIVVRQYGVDFVGHSLKQVL
jgi:hypothetical protein